MIIKRWDDSLQTPAWVNEAPKTTASSIYTTSSFAVALFDGNSKLKPEYLPDVALGGLKFEGTITNENVNTAEELIGLFQGSLNVLNLNTIVGKYWIASETISGMNASASTVVNTKYYCVSFDGYKEEDQAGGATTSPTLEAGDWLVLTGISIGEGANSISNPYNVRLSVVNNTYRSATSTNRGIVEIFSDTVQTEAAQTVTSTSSRTYGTQYDGEGRLVVNVPWENTTYSAATSNDLGLLKIGFTEANKDYAVKLDANDKAYVTVPWENTTYAAADSTTLGLVKVGGYTSNDANRLYGISIDENDQLYVCVPWVNTTYSEATTTAAGLVEIAFAKQTTARTVETETTTSGRFYGITLNNNGQAIVNVPWANTTYTAGDGITLNGTDFDVDYPVFYADDLSLVTGLPNAIGFEW